MELLVSHKSLNFTGWGYLNPVASIRILSWFDNPYSLLFWQLLVLEFLYPNVIFISRNDMVSVWQNREWVHFLYFWVIPMHKFEENFFWSNYRIVRDVICQQLYVYLGIHWLETHVTSGVRCISLLDLFWVENFQVAFLWVRRFCEFIFQTKSGFSVNLLIAVAWPSLLFLLKLSRMNFFLGVLGPDKISLAFTCGQFKPEPSLDNASDKLRVVSRAYKNFVGFFSVSIGVSWEGQININWVREVDFVQKLNESCDFFLINCVWSNVWHSKNHFIWFFLEKTWNITT